MSADHQTANKPHFSHQQLIDGGKFSKADVQKIQTYRGKHNRLGFAYQLTYVRIFNCFPKQKPFEISEEILNFSSLQLDIDNLHIKEYVKHRQHIARHQEQIRIHLKLSTFDTEAHKKLVDYLFKKAQQIDQMGLLMAEAKVFLRNQHILQPGQYTLERLIIRYRKQGNSFLQNLIRDLVRKSRQTLTNYWKLIRFGNLNYKELLPHRAI